MKPWEVMDWAWTVPIDSSPERVVLAAYAWRAGAKLIAWPGLDQLVADTSLYRETVSTARKGLVRHGYLVDTGQRRGYSGRVTVYRLDVTNRRGKPLIESVDKRAQSAAKAANYTPDTGGKSREEERQMPPSDERGKPLQNYELNNPLNSSSAQAREQDQVAPNDSMRIEGLESPIDKIRRTMPNLAHILPAKGT